MLQQNDASSDVSESEMLLVTSTTNDAAANTLKTNDTEDVQTIQIRDKYRVVVIAVAVICVISIVIGVTTVLRCTKNNSNNKPRRNTDNLKLFFHVSDTHLDLFYNKSVVNFYQHVSGAKKSEQYCRNIPRKDGTPIELANNEAVLGRVGCDSPTRLVQSAAIAMQKITLDSQESAEFVLLTGDQTAHDYRQFNLNLLESVYWSIGNSTRIFWETLRIPVLVAIGNNDVFYDYVPPTEPGDPFFLALRMILEPYIFPVGYPSQDKEDFRKTFDVGGYYKYTTKGDNLVIVILNTNYWSQSGYMMNNSVTIIGDIQMEWLNSTLLQAQVEKKKVFLTGHIPCGYDGYNNGNLWLANYTEIYVKLTTQTYANTVPVHLYGHTHADQIKILNSQDSQGGYLLICPSITPNYENNPAFRLVEYDEEYSRLHDYTQYSMDLSASNVQGNAVWQKEYAFQDVYDTVMIFSKMNKLVDSFLDVLSPFWYAYRNHMRSNYGSVLNSKRYSEYCAAKYFDKSNFNNCVEKYKNVGV